MTGAEIPYMGMGGGPIRSGAEIHVQALDSLHIDATPQERKAAEAALAPCIVLTAEEAGKVRGGIILASHGIITKNVSDELGRCMALLTKEADDDDA
jgi:hypothetical protein